MEYGHYTPIEKLRVVFDIPEDRSIKYLKKAGEDGDRNVVSKTTKMGPVQRIIIRISKYLDFL